jgi:hypothetical protein
VSSERRRMGGKSVAASKGNVACMADGVEKQQQQPFAPTRRSVTANAIEM